MSVSSCPLTSVWPLFDPLFGVFVLFSFFLTLRINCRDKSVTYKSMGLLAYSKRWYQISKEPLSRCLFKHCIFSLFVRQRTKNKLIRSWVKNWGRHKNNWTTRQKKIYRLKDMYTHIHQYVSLCHISHNINVVVNQWASLCAFTNMKGIIPSKQGFLDGCKISVKPSV